MSVTPSSAIVGVFRDRAVAEQAMDALYNAGFTHEQVRYSAPENSGGFFEDLKSLFTGSGTDNGSVANDLTDMGLSDEEAQYYATEHSNGNIILAVKAPGRGQEAQTIMQQYGALNAQAHTDSFQDTAQPVQHMIEDTQQVAPSSDVAIETTQPTIHENTLDSYQSQAHENTLDPQSQTPEGTTAHTMDSDEVQPTVTNSIDESETVQPMSTDYNEESQTSQASMVSDTQAMTHDYIPEEAHAAHTSNGQEAQPMTTDDSSEEYVPHAADVQDVQPMTTNYTTEQLVSHAQDVQPVTTEYSAEAQTATNNDAAALQATNDDDTADMQAIHMPEAQAAQPVVTEYNTEQPAAQPVVTDYTTEQPAAQPVVTEYNTEQPAAQFSDDQPVQSNEPTQPLTNTTTHDQGTTTAQPVGGSIDHTDELQSLQAQIASLQQQLQDAKAQLQEAKEREAQIQTAREREQQLQTLKQQMQELQAELDATHTELRETHARIGQYQ